MPCGGIRSRPRFGTASRWSSCPTPAGRLPRIAAHLGRCGQTVRDLLRAFLARGTEALRPFRSGPPPDAARRAQVTDELKRLLAEDRTWTSRQLARALAGRGIALGARQVRRYLKRLGARTAAPPPR